jgi:hypothetical protein
MVEDLNYRNERLTKQIMTRAKEFATKGVLDNYLQELLLVGGDDLTINKGACYVLGERAELFQVTHVAVPDGLWRVYAKYQQEADPDPNATRLDDLGQAHVVWYRDGITFGLADPEQTPIPDDEVTLGLASMSNGTVTVNNLRDYVSLNIPLRNQIIQTAWLGAQCVTNPKIANLAVNAAKVADNGITEVKLAPGTGWVPLILDRQEKTVAGQSCNPESSVFYWCATGNDYEYKIFGRLMRDATAGPVRRLRLIGKIGASAGGLSKVYLVAWNEPPGPGEYNPDDPGYTGLKVMEEFTGPAAFDLDIELDVSTLDVAEHYRLAYGVVLRNDAADVLALSNILLLALR